MKLNKRKSIVKDTLSADGYNNFAAKLGMQANNLAAKGTYTYGKTLSRQRALLEIIYRTSWVAGQVVDTIAEDMTKEGINMFSEMAPDDIQSMQSALTELNIFGAICENIKWSRLYGGSIAVILIEGADYSRPLNIERIGKDQFKGIVVFDRWQIEPSLSDLITEIGPDMGLPKYYTILPSMETLSGEKIHYSRVIRMDGIKMPYYQRRIDNFWGMSIIERLYDRLIAFDSGTAGAAQMLYKAYLRVVQVDGLRAALAVGGKQEQAVIKQFQYIQMLQSQEGITLLDSKDQFSTHQYTFSGVSDVLIQLGQQISGATNIPLVRLFGQSPAGFSTGDTDLRNYYDHIGKLQENVLRMPVRKILEILSRSLLGKNLPEDFEFEFSSLWEMSEVEKSQIASSDSSTISNYFQSGIITKRIALKELLQQSRTTGRFTNISNEDIENALEEPPEHQGMEMGGENEDNTQSLVKPGKQELDLSNLEKALNDLNTLEQDNRSFNAEGILENLEKELQSLDIKTLEQLETELNTIINGGKTLESLEAELKTLGLSDNTIKLLSQQLEEIKLSSPKKKMPVTDRGMSFEMAVRNSFGITEDARARAPKGGITIKGKEFTGGEFIPTEGGYAEAFEKMKKEKKASAKAEKGKSPEKQDKKKNDKKEIIAALKAKLKQQSAKEGTKRTVKTAAYNYAKRDKDGKIVMGDGKGIPSHLKGVAIPPAWKNFLISPSGKDKCWLIAFDENGKRLGSIYSPKHVEGRDFKKDAMLNDLNKNLDVIQKQLDEGQRKEESFQKAFITKLLAITGARVGSNEESMSAKGKTYGVSTLEGRHIVKQDDGSVQLNFIGKRGKENIYIVKDKQAIKKLLELKKKAGDKGRLFDEKYNDLLGYVKELDGGGFTPHNFRTKIATDTAIELISKAPAPSNLKEYKKAVKEIAKAVGNRICDTPATALKSYIVTSVFTDWKIKAGIE